MAIREILVDWTTAAGSGRVSVFHFNTSTPVGTQRDALRIFLDACSTTLAASTTWTIRTSGRELDEVTGTLVGEWVDTSPETGGGAAGNGSVLADATQVLVRWNTNTIARGRFVKGRTYLPGIFRNVSENGNVYVASVTAVGNAAQFLVDSGAGLVVWHRPVNRAGGRIAPVTQGSCWSEFAVQRRRRG